VRELVFLKGNPQYPINPDNGTYNLVQRAYLESKINEMLEAGMIHCDTAGEVALKTWKLLECRDGGRVDIRHNKIGLGAVPNFIEVNPIAGLAPNWFDLLRLAKVNGISFDRLLDLMMDSALRKDDDLSGVSTHYPSRFDMRPIPKIYIMGCCL